MDGKASHPRGPGRAEGPAELEEDEADKVLMDGAPKAGAIIFLEGVARMHVH